MMSVNKGIGTSVPEKAEKTERMVGDGGGT